MARNNLLLQRSGFHRPERNHDGKVILMRSNLCWGSDGLEFACWNGDVIRAALLLGLRQCANQVGKSALFVFISITWITEKALLELVLQVRWLYADDDINHRQNAKWTQFQKVTRSINAHPVVATTCNTQSKAKGSSGCLGIAP